MNMFTFNPHCIVKKKKKTILNSHNILFYCKKYLGKQSIYNASDIAVILEVSSSAMKLSIIYTLLLH